MVRSTLPYLCLWSGLRLILGVPALVRGFDTLTQFLWQMQSTNQEILRQTLKTLLELSLAWVWARSDNGKSWVGDDMCRQKVVFLRFWWIFRFFSELSQDEIIRISASKTRYFHEFLMIFKRKWCEALSLTFASGPVFVWFWGSPRYCMILTLWPHTFDRNTQQIIKFLNILSKLY